jgi:hypothetical protein
MPIAEGTVVEVFDKIDATVCCFLYSFGGQPAYRVRYQSLSGKTLWMLVHEDYVKEKTWKK